jgi:FAD/FMN-containing dehydrogenase
MNIHDEKVRRIAAHVRGLAAGAPAGTYFSLKKKAVSHMVPQPGDPKHGDRKIDMRDLTEILSIDPASRTCKAEPGVTFERLVRETLPHGLVPTTVSELKTITIGGAVAGCSVESMSYRLGGFHDGCLEYEVVTGLGEIVRCSRQDRPELFEMIHGSFGTLGILTELTFRLVPAKPFVRMDYRTYSSFDDLMRSVEKEYRHPEVDFMDAIVHSPENCVLCLGTFVDKAPYTNRYRRKIFYKSTRKRDLDYLVTPDYFFRYDADCHWISRNYGLENPILRSLAGPFVLGSSTMLRLADRFSFLMPNPEAPDVVADIFVPYSKSRDFFDWYDKTFNYYPLWVVPYRIERMYPWVNPDLMKGIDDQLYIDCAIYGFRQKGNLNYYRALEEMVFQLQGMKTLITHNYYSPEEFWESYNRPLYEKVKAQVDPRNLFRDLYLKTHHRKSYGA